jgi:transposase
MAREFRPAARDQVFLLPPDMREWLPGDHLVWFVLDTLETVDLSEFEARRRRGGVGAAGYDPRMLLGLLIYAYCRGVRSSRQVERLCGTDVAFRVLCAQDVPDHCTLARFRADCQHAFASLFTQVLMIAGHAGLARFGTVAIDGTKIAANASMDANRGRDWLAEEVDRMLIEADHVDAVEDRAAGRGQLTGEGDRVPATLASPQDRLARIRAAAEEVTRQTRQQAQAEQSRNAAARARRERAEAGEPVIGRIPAGPHRLAEAQAHLSREITRQQAKLDRRAAIIAAGKKPMGSPPVPVEEHSSVIRSRRAVEAALVAEATQAATDAGSVAAKRLDGNKLPKIVANITDPSSRLMPTRRGFLQGYNAQVAVTSDQMIAAVQVSQSPNDMAAFTPMMAAAQAAARHLHEETGRDEHTIGVVLADAGYCSDANLAAPGPDRLIAISKNRDQLKTAREHPTSGPIPAGFSPRQAMEHRLRTVEGIALYKRRGATVEPGIGNLKKIIDRFSRRGRDAAASELHLAATAFNLMKIHRAAAPA